MQRTIKLGPWAHAVHSTPWAVLICSSDYPGWSMGCTWCGTYITLPLSGDAQKSHFDSAIQLPAKTCISKHCEEKESLSFYRASKWPNEKTFSVASLHTTDESVCCCFFPSEFFSNALFLSCSACSDNSFYLFCAKDWVFFNLKDMNTFDVNIILPLMYLLLRLPGMDANTT